jgi:hypothetical protein
MLNPENSASLVSSRHVRNREHNCYLVFTLETQASLSTVPVISSATVNTPYHYTAEILPTACIRKTYRKETAGQM